MKFLPVSGYKVLSYNGESVLFLRTSQKKERKELDQEATLATLIEIGTNTLFRLERRNDNPPLWCFFCHSSFLFR